MLKRKIIFSVSMIVIFVFGFVFGTTATSIKESIKAYVDRSLKVEVNGENITFSADTPPISYNGHFAKKYGGNGCYKL